MQDKDKIIEEKIDNLANEAIVAAMAKFKVVPINVRQGIELLACMHRVYRSGYAAGKAVPTRKGTEA